MAVTNLPILRTVITGDGVTALDKSLSLTLGEKLELTYVLKSTDSPISINYAAISNITAILFYGTSSYTVSLSIDIGTTETPNVVVIPFEVANTFRLDPSTTFMGKITAISISTSSTSSTVSVAMYGAVS